MLFRSPKQVPKCEIARHIKHSILQVKHRGKEIKTWYEDRYPYNLTELRSKDALCLFYVKNDIIIYYYVKDYEEDFYIMPLYNYRKESYDIIRVKQNISLSEMDTYVAIVKAPNGKIYGLLDYEYVVIIEDFVKGESIYRHRSGSNKFGLFTQYSLPIANSFIVIVKVTEEEVIVNVFDLVKENKSEVRFHLRKYRDFILEQLPGDSEIRNWVNKYLYYLGTQLKISGLKHSIDRLNNETLFYKKAIFEISLCYTIYNEHTGKEMRCFIINSPIITVEYKDNNLVVSMETGTDGVIKAPKSTFKIKPNVLLEAKEYQLDKEEYNILNSHLYTIFDASENYEIIKVSSKPSWHVYQKGELTHSVEGSQSVKITRLQNISIMRILDNWFAILTKRQHRKMYDKKYYVLFTLQEQLSFVDIEKLYNKLKESGEHGIIMEVSNLVTNVDIVSEVKDLLPDVIDSIYGTSVKNSKYSFDVRYYFDGEHKALYLIVAIHVPANANVQGGRSFAMIFKKLLDKSNGNHKRPILVWYSNPKWTKWTKIRNSIFLFNHACFYYISDILDFAVTIKTRELQQPGALIQYDMMVIKPNKNRDERCFYEAKHNRLSVLVRIDATEVNPILCTLSLTKRDKLLNA